jgi:predicted nucleic acid-binding Zn ribbon protein
VLRKLSDAPLTQCPECGNDTFAKQVTAAGFQLKGSGWYVTDFRGGNTGGGAKKPGNGSDSTGDGAKPAGDEASKSAEAPAKSESAAPAAKSESAAPASGAASANGSGA